MYSGATMRDEEIKEFMALACVGALTLHQGHIYPKTEYSNRKRSILPHLISFSTA